MNGVGDSEIKASLQCVCDVPRVFCGIEDPLLETCGGLSCGVRVEVGSARVAVSFASYVEGVSVGEPKTEGCSGGSCCSSEFRRKAGEDAHVGWGVGSGIQGEWCDGQRCS